MTSIHIPNLSVTTQPIRKMIAIFSKDMQILRTAMVAKYCSIFEKELNKLRYTVLVAIINIYINWHNSF